MSSGSNVYASIFSLVTLSWCSGTYDDDSDGTARVLDVYAIPDGSGLGSGLDMVGDLPLRFVMVTDRGPNGDRADGGKYFPEPEFTPTIAEVHLEDGAVVIDRRIPILTASAGSVTGISNTANDDVPYAYATGPQRLPLNENGLDTEDVRVLPNGDFLLVEEYSPSIIIVSGTTGHVLARYTPHGLTLPNADYPVLDILPEIFTTRKANRGFEGVALSPDGSAYIVLQQPLEAESDDELVRVLRIDDVADPSLARVGGEYFVEKKMKFFNSATWIGPDRLLLLGRDDDRLKLIDVDLTTNPATRDTVFDSDDTPELVLPSKTEGLAVINATTVAITNDNDFGIVDPQDETRIWIIRLEAPLF